MRSNEELGTTAVVADCGATVVRLREDIDRLTRCYLKALAEFDASRGYERDGATTLVAWLRSHARVAAGAAYADIALARRLYGDASDGLPLVAAAVESGSMTLDHARAVARETAALAPALLVKMEPLATAAARRLGPAELGRVCAQARRTVIAEQERQDNDARPIGPPVDGALVDFGAAVDAAAKIESEHRQAEFDSRFFRRIDHGRMVSFEGMLPRIDAEAFWAVVSSLAKPNRRVPSGAAAPSDGARDDEADKRSASQRQADAVAEMAKLWLASGKKSQGPAPIAQVQVIVDLDDLLKRVESNGISQDSGSVSPTRETGGRIARGAMLHHDELARLCCDAEVSVSIGKRLSTLDRRTTTAPPSPGGSQPALDALSPFASQLGLDAQSVKTGFSPTQVVLDRALTVVAPALGGAGFEILAQGRSKRLVTPGLRRALVARDRGCVMPGCDRPPEWCEAHHVTPWIEGGRTDLDDLALLCSRDHHVLHQKGWTLRRNSCGGFDVFKGGERADDLPTLQSR